MLKYSNFKKVLLKGEFAQIFINGHGASFRCGSHQTPSNGRWLKYDCFPIDAVYVNVECRSCVHILQVNFLGTTKGTVPFIAHFGCFFWGGGGSQNTIRDRLLTYDCFPTDVVNELVEDDP